MKFFKTGTQIAATLAFVATSVPMITFTTEADAAVVCKAPATLVTRTIRGKTTTGCLLPARTKLPVVCNSAKTALVTRKIFKRTTAPISGTPYTKKVRQGGRDYYFTDTGKTVTSCVVTPVKAVKKKCRLGFRIVAGACVSNKTPTSSSSSSSGPNV